MINNIPKKNYKIYSMIVFFTVLISLIIFVAYNKHKEYVNSIPILRGIVSELDVNEIDDFLKENNNIILYMGVATDENSRELETSLIRLRDRRNIDFVYLNLTDVKDKMSFLDSFNDKYSVGAKVKKYPAFIIIKDCKIVDLVQKEDRDLYVGDIEHLLDMYEIDGELND